MSDSYSTKNNQITSDIQMSLESITGPLAEAYKQFQPDTILHASEIMNERRTNEKLREQWFWTADSALYTVEEGEAILYFGNRDTNLIFENINEATKQLRETNNYRPEQADVERVINSVETGQTLRLNLSDLKLDRYNSEWSYFKISTSKYNKLNDSQRAFAEKVFGEGTDFKTNMKMLKEADIESTRILVLNPKYVEKQASESPVSLTCWLSGFSGYSGFIASEKITNLSNGYVRGVLKVTEGDAPENPIQTAYQTILKTPINKLQTEANPEVIQKMLKIGAEYVKNL